MVSGWQPPFVGRFVAHSELELLWREIEQLRQVDTAKTLSSFTGLDGFVGTQDPAMNGWAIFEGNFPARVRDK